MSGWVRNTSAGVEIHVEGDAASVAGFVAALPEQAPPRSYIASLERSAAAPEGHTAFTILESSVDPDAYQLVSPDIATCDDCRREVLDEADRRHGYPFTNCTNCGPRFTIIESLPYDRERTTMRAFPLCPACRKEYEDPLDRRFHAEPNACPVCGPRVRLVRVESKDGEEATGGAALEGGVVELAAGDEVDPAAPIAAAADLLRRGAILAIKGLGGFHLACDATDGDAVRRLKRRKGRPHKPLAVMVGDLAELRRHCLADEAEAALLEAPEHPIVLLRWREVDARGVMGPELGGAGTADAETAPAASDPEIDREVAVGQSYLGAMLPYTPLHLLLLRAAGRPLVMTSGNLAEEPIVKGWEEAGRLRGIADAYLVHDREIAARYDDSVATVERGRPRLLRRSRGYAPFPIILPRALPQVLACGAELKNTFCLTRDANAFLSQHIGDLENLETLEHYEASIALYERLFRLEPEVVAYDLHPEYLATKHALSLPHEVKLPTAASPRPHRRPHDRARRHRAGHRGELGRPGLRRRRAAVGRGGLRLRPARLPARRASGDAAAGRRRGGDRTSLADGARLERRAARGRGVRAGRRAARARRTRRGSGRPAADRRRGGGRRRPGPRRRQCAADDELRPPLRRRRRAGRRPRRGDLRGSGGDRARDDVAGRRRAVPVRDRGRRRDGAVFRLRRRRPARRARPRLGARRAAMPARRAPRAAPRRRPRRRRTGARARLHRLAPARRRLPGSCSS